MTLSCFKAYDVRGKLGEELNEDIAYRIGRAFAQYYDTRSVVVGSDVRATSYDLKAALTQGILDAGSDVIDIGMSGSEEVYYATFHLGTDGGIEVTASHNPIDFNGMKFVGKDAAGISSDNGLRQIQKLAELGQFISRPRGHYRQQSTQGAYIQHLLGMIDVGRLSPLKIVTNAGNGAAGPVIDGIEAYFQQQQVPIEFIKIHHQADPTFPHGIPNPLLPENQRVTADAVRDHQADLGIAWDGDFDRCFLFDHQGRFINGTYIVGLLAQYFLQRSPGEKIIHDSRLVWNTIDAVISAGGEPIASKTGHAFIKDRMRAENAIYGGEISAHHYFRDFAYCDSGMIPWLLVISVMSERNMTLAQLISDRMLAFPCSSEINFTVSQPQRVIARVKAQYVHSSDLVTMASIDGLSMAFSHWRFNLRPSNTEPLLRLNMETRGDEKLLAVKLAELQQLILG